MDRVASGTARSTSIPHPKISFMGVNAFTTGNPFGGQLYLELVWGGIWGLKKRGFGIQRVPSMEALQKKMACALLPYAACVKIRY